MDGDPVSGHTRIFPDGWLTEQEARRRQVWHVMYAHYQDGTKLTDALNEGWEPFACEHDVVWLKRFSLDPLAPLPPQ